MFGWREERYSTRKHGSFDRFAFFKGVGVGLFVKPPRLGRWMFEYEQIREIYMRREPCVLLGQINRMWWGCACNKELYTHPSIKKMIDQIKYCTCAFCSVYCVTCVMR
jgi:hypothetical protein